MKYAFTHGGRFHADDVFSAALLTMLYPEIEIQRGFEIPEDFDGIVFDIGFGKYDHHQQDRRVRENGVSYAAFGLLWEDYGTNFLKEEMAKKFDEKFIQPLDEADNTGCKNEIAEVIGSFNPGWNEELEPDTCFEEAKQVAIQILKRKFAYLRGEEEAECIVAEAIKKVTDHILVLEQFVPWKKQVAGTEIDFVIYPSKRGGYNAQAVPISEENPELKYRFPEEWGGKDAEELQKLSGIATLTFCHNSGFLIATQTFEDAKLACKMAKEKIE